ncbi:MAG: replicative DNA helicase [Candidatus Delongbacteria bacterium]
MERVPGVLPHSEEAEKSVLSAILIGPAALDRVVQVLRGPDDFHQLAHRLIYEAMLGLADTGSPCDILSVERELNRMSQRGKSKGDCLAEAGGLDYLQQLALVVESAANAEYHAGIVREKALLRQIIRTTDRLMQEACSPGSDPTDLLNMAESDFFQLHQGIASQDFVGMRQLMGRTIELLEKMDEGQGLLGVDTGYHVLNHITSGWQRTDMIILAARPSMGKTALALNFLLKAARVGTPVLMFSLEMSSEQLAYRLLSTVAGVDSRTIRTKRWGTSADTHKRIGRAVQELGDMPIFIDETPGIGVAELRSKARRAVSLHGVKFIVVDYLQLMNLPPRAESHQLGIAQISKSLKALAKELNVPIMALSQLSRQVEQRGGDKRPMLSDLRDSGAIEQDADLVLFVYRPEMYEQTDSQGNPTAGRAEVIIGKHRNGPTGAVSLHFNKDIGLFSELDLSQGAAEGGRAEVEFHVPARRRRGGEGGES